MSKEQMRPASNEAAPDPANTYERAKPQNESPSGSLDKPKTPPANTPDKIEQSVPQQQNPARQINGDEAQSGKAARDGTPQANQPPQSQPPQSQPSQSQPSQGQPSQSQPSQKQPGSESTTPPQPDHSMNDEPETGWDTAPDNLSDSKSKRHPRTGGKGGTPDSGEKSVNS